GDLFMSIAAGAAKLNLTLTTTLLAASAPDDNSDSSKKTTAKTSSTGKSTAQLTNTNNPQAKKADASDHQDPAKQREAADEKTPSAIDRAREVKERAAASRGETVASPATGASPTTGAMGATVQPTTTAPAKGTPSKIKVVGRKRASLAFLLAAGSVAAIATQPLWVNDLYQVWGQAAPGGGTDARFQQIDNALIELTDDMRNLSGRGQGVGVEQLQQVIARIDQDIANLEDSVANRPIASGGVQVTTDPRAIERLRRDIGRDLEPLASEISDLSGRLDALEQTGQGGVPTQQVNTVLAAGTLLSAVRGSAPFPAELSALIRLGATDPAITGAISTLELHANDGVPTARQLADGLAATAARALQAIHMDEEASLIDRTLGQLQGLVTVRRSPGQVEGDDPAALLARAEDSLRSGNVSGALDLIDRLPTPAVTALEAWRTNADARLDVEQASRIILSRATDLALSGGGR
ncbi:MAG: mitofilin family membrane protein, partial [Pseudomonadota bacterium]